MKNIVIKIKNLDILDWIEFKKELVNLKIILRNRFRMQFRKKRRKI